MWVWPPRLDRCRRAHMWLMAGSWEAGWAVWVRSAVQHTPQPSPRINHHTRQEWDALPRLFLALPVTHTKNMHAHTHTHRHTRTYTRTLTPVSGCFFQCLCEVGILTVAGSSCSTLHLSWGDDCREMKSVTCLTLHHSAHLKLHRADFFFFLWTETQLRNWSERQPTWWNIYPADSSPVCPNKMCTSISIFRFFNLPLWYISETKTLIFDSTAFINF